MKHLTAEELAIYVDALKEGTTNKLPKDLLDHIAKCDECASEVIDFYEIEKDDQAVTTRKSKIRPLYYATAAIAASLLVFLLINLNGFKSGNPDGKISGNIIPNDTTSVIEDPDTVNDSIADPLPEKNKPQNIIKDLKPQNEVLLAENFQPNSNLEKLVDRYRGELRGEEIEVLTPIELRLKEGSPVYFKWNIEETIELMVEVYNNKEEKIDESSTSDTKYRTKAIKTKGLYYWKLFNEDFDLIFCGKIVIE